MAKSFKKSTEALAAELFISAADEQEQEARQEDLGENKPRLGYKIGYIPENKTERMQLLVKPSIKKAIKELSAKRELSMNELINQIFEEYLERQE